MRYLRGGQIIYSVEVTEKVRWKWQKWQPVSEMLKVEVTELVIGNERVLMVGYHTGLNFGGYEFKKLKGH